MPDLHLKLDIGSDEAPVSKPLSETEAIRMLESAGITAATLVPWGSNYTFAVGLTDPEGRSHLGIYKPQAGERPLWDFPHGTLYRREYASYLLSRALGWNLVPPTVIRDGPHGEGSVQLYIEPTTDEVDEHSFWGQQILAIERMVLFDHIANNADRKIGHCLLDTRHRIWGIDHGLTFNVEPKLRTVLWQFSGEPVSPELLRDLDFLVDSPASFECLEQVLAVDEIRALRARIEHMRARRRYPELDPYTNVPYGWW